MENEEVLTQVTLKVKESQFLCNRKLLADHSPYFHAMFNNDFKEKHEKLINLQGIEPEALEFLINAMGKVNMDFTKAKNILDVLQASCMLQFDNIQNECVKFMFCSWLDKETWLPTANMADKLGLTELKQKTKTLALWNFSEVRKTEQFLYLTSEEVIEFLSDNRLRTTEGEFEVFEAGVNWIEHSLEDRLFYSLPLLSVVRFQDMEPFDIRNMLHFSSVKDTPQAELIIECILEIKDGIINQNCESCNPSVNDDEDSLEAGKSSPLPSGLFLKNSKRKRRTTSHCTCFDTTTIKTAEDLLAREPRCLPLFPCIVASYPFKKPLGESPITKFRNKTKCPFLFRWNGDQLVPFIHLSKIDEGPAGAMGYKVVVQDLKLYVIGGEYMMGQGDWNTSIWFYDTWKQDWQFETSLPSPRRHHSAVCVNNELYVIGGVGRHRVILDSVSKYSLDTKNWKTCSPLPTKQYSAACCVYKDDIYLFGSQLYCFRQSIGNWETLSTIFLPDNVIVSAAMTDGEIIYAIGSNAKLYSFVPQPKNVEVKFLGQFRLAASSACLVNNEIYSFGEDDDTQAVEQYHIKRKTFTTLYYNKKEDDEESFEFYLNQAAGCFPLPKYY